MRRRTAIGVVALTLVATACAFAGSQDGSESTSSVAADVPAISIEMSVEASTVPEDAAQPPDTAAAEGDEVVEGDEAGEGDSVDSGDEVVQGDEVDSGDEVVEVVEVGSGDEDVVTRSADAVGDGVLPEGVGTVTARVTSADGEVCEVCLWLADDDATRQRGLMGVTDLGDAVGMAFRWDQPRTGNFYMFQTPTPLSIAWFDDAGSHVGQADMEPCLVDDSAVCERYAADSPYVLAVEMFGGQLGAIGIGPGSIIELSDLPCI